MVPSTIYTILDPQKLDKKAKKEHFIIRDDRATPIYEVAAEIKTPQKKGKRVAEVISINPNAFNKRNKMD